MRAGHQGFSIFNLLAGLAVFATLAAMVGGSLTSAAAGEAISRNRAIAAKFADNANRLRTIWRHEGTGAPVENLAGLADGTADLNRGGWVVGTTAGPREDAASVEQCIEILGLLAPAVRPGTDYRARHDGSGGCIYERLTADRATVRTPAGCPLHFHYSPIPGAASVSTACEADAGSNFLFREG